MNDPAAAAAGNNAQWCDLVCRAHGLPTSRQGGVWSARRRSPAGYPDAVTLKRGVPPADVLALVDDAPGCSVKDSFGDLDLVPFGFEVLFEAEWIQAAPLTTGADTTVRWTLVTAAEEFAAWAAAAGASDVLGPYLLGDPAVRVLVARDGDGVRAGAIANRSAAVVGVSNVFCATMAADAVWADIVSTLSVCFPGLPLVGYELAADRLPALRGVHRGRPIACMAASHLTWAARSGLGPPHDSPGGELLGLRWDDLDLRSGALHIRRSLQIGADGRALLAEPKTARSRLQVLLTALSLAALGDMGRPGPDLHRLTEGCCARRTCCGAPLVPLLARPACHGSASTICATPSPRCCSPTAATLDVYSHVTATMQRQAVDALARTLGGQLGGQQR